MKNRSKKAKGTRLEKWCVDQLRTIGVPARKQPMSGALQDFPHDVCGELPDGRFIVECKSWKAGWRTGDRAMGAADCLVMKRDYATPAVYMSWDFFARLVGLANGGRGSDELIPDDDVVRLHREAPEIFRQAMARTNVSQSLLTGKSGKPKAKPLGWPKRAK